MGVDQGLPKALLRKLETLSYPEVDSAGLQGESYCKIVLWLEEEKIRLYTPQQRKTLRDFNDAWYGHVATYARELGVQADGLDDSSLSTKLRVLNQLVNAAVHDIYRDKVEAKEVALAAPSKPIEGGLETQQRLKDLVPHINRLLGHLKLPNLSKEAIDTDAIAALRCLKTRLCPPAKAGAPVDVDMDVLPEGLDIKDPEVRKVAGVLRLLHSIEMGQLQVNINETINDLQILTADPKTDARLGKEDALCREQGAVDALASHFELLAQLLRQAPAGEGLQALCTPLRESSAQLGRGLEERKEPRRKQSWDGATPDPGETVRAARSSEDPGDLHPASEHSHSAGPDDALPATSPPFVGTEHRRSSFSVGSSAASSKPQLRRSMSSIPTFSPNVIKRAEEWAEDQRVLQELRLGDSASEFGSDGDPVENASRAFHCLRGIVGNARYEVFWAAVVMVNTCTMILEEEWTGMRAGHRIGVYEQYGSEEYIDQWWPSAQAAFFAIDCVFSLMFTVELMLTFTYDVWNNLLGFGIHFRHPFWTNPWDWLDFVIVVSSNLALLVGFSDGPVSKARFFRIFRLVRLLRLVRLVRKINSLDPLHLMTTAIAGSAVALVFSILLLLLIQTMFAMILTQVLRYGWLSEESSPLSEGVQMQLFRYFGTYTRSMVTMFELMLANWPKVGRFLMEDVHEVFGYVVVVYKLSIGFAVIAVINGVFIQETFSVAQNDEFIMVRKRLRQMEHHKQTISRLFKMGDKDKSGTLSRAELGRLLKKRAIRTWLEAMDLRCSDPDMLFTLIAGDEDEVGLDAFVAGLGRLKGTARNIDMIAVLDILQQHQQSIMNDLQMLVKDIRRSPPEAPRAQARGPDEELPA